MLSDEYLDTIVDESRGVATEEQKQSLYADLESWRSGLIQLKNKADGTVSFLRAKFNEETSERMDPSEYRAMRGVMLNKRAKTLHFKRSIDNRLREVNAMIKASEGSYRDLLIAVLGVIDLDGIYNDVPPHLHELLSRCLKGQLQPA